MVGSQGSSAQKHAAPRLRWWWVPKPLLVTLFGAALSAWLVPAFTRQYQDRQKEREIKVALVSQIGDATSNALVTSQFVAAQTFPQGGQAEFNRLALEWARQSAAIEAKLAAYFPRSVVVREWRDYAVVVQRTTYLVTRDRGPRKNEAVRTVRAYVTPARGIDWNLFLPSMKYSDPHALDNYLSVAQEVLKRKEALIQKILDAHAQGFSTTTSHLLRDMLPFV